MTELPASTVAIKQSLSVSSHLPLRLKKKQTKRRSQQELPRLSLRAPSRGLWWPISIITFNRQNPVHSLHFRSPLSGKVKGGCSQVPASYFILNGCPSARAGRLLIKRSCTRSETHQLLFILTYFLEFKICHVRVYPPDCPALSDLTSQTGTSGPLTSHPANPDLTNKIWANKQFVHQSSHLLSEQQLKNWSKLINITEFSA